MAPRKRKTQDAKILKYPDSDMQAAIVAVKENRFKIREAARHFGVPHSTLISKVKGRVPLQRKMGRSTYFTTDEEDLLVKHIIANAKKGIPVNRRTLLETVKKILDDDKRVTPFKNNTPGKKWISLFYDRHPEISEKKAEGISTSRAQVSSEDLKQWHQSLKEYLIEENALDIIEDPKRIFNADESGFQTCPDSGKVIGPVNMKNFYEIKSGQEKEQLTVMLTINAAGQIVSPMVVYPLVRISRDIAINVPESWSIGKSPSGWMNGPLYYEYIANVFDPWLKANNIQKPVLLLVDGHRSHLTLQVSQYCAENQIIAYALFPNSTHISQPADVSVFKCLKSGWKTTVSEYKQKSGNRQITRAGFAPLLAKVFQEKATPEIVANGFKRCGLYPFDVNGIDFARCMDHDSRKTAPVSAPTSTNCVAPAPIVGVETLLIFESFMRRGRVQEFRRSNEHWEGDESAKELFYTWKKFRQCCLSASPTSSAGNCHDFADSSESHRAMTQSPSLLRVQSTDAEVLTRCITPVQEVPVHSGKAGALNNCSTPASNAPNLLEVSHSLKGVLNSMGPDLPPTDNLVLQITVPYSSESQRAMTQSPSLLRVQSTADMQSSTQMLKPKIPSQKQNTGGTPDELVTRLLSSEMPNLVMEAEVLTRCSTLVQEVLVLSDRAGVLNNCSTPPSNAPNLLEVSHSLKEVLNSMGPNLPPTDNLVSQITVQIPDLPKGSETPTANMSPVSKAPHFPKGTETKTPDHSFKVRTTKTQTPKPPGPTSPKITLPGPSSDSQGFSSSPKNVSLIIQKQKQVSPAFGNHLIWPSDSPVKKTRKERLPFATSSKKWQDYWIMKDDEKKQKSIQAETRKRIREEKKAQKTAKVKKGRMKRVERSDSSESDEEMIDQEITVSDGETDIENEAEEEYEEEKKPLKGFEKGNFVIFIYEGSYFVGQIISTCEEGLLIKSMHKSLNNWRWPNKEDLNLYRFEDIKEKIQEPRIINQKRGIYSVPEFAKYGDFM